MLPAGYADTERGSRAYPKILETCLRLEVVAVVEVGKPKSVAGGGNYVHKKVVECGIRTYVEDWKMGARGQYDSWNYAREVIESRNKV